MLKFVSIKAIKFDRYLFDVNSCKSYKLKHWGRLNEFGYYTIYEVEPDKWVVIRQLRERGMEKLEFMNKLPFTTKSKLFSEILSILGNNRKVQNFIFNIINNYM